MTTRSQEVPRVLARRDEPSFCKTFIDRCCTCRESEQSACQSTGEKTQEKDRTEDSEMYGLWLSNSNPSASWRGGFAEGCEECWKDAGYKGTPPCNVQKSRYAEKAQKQLEKAQKRKDQKTPAEVEAERRQAARQEKLEEIRAKSPLKQALFSLILHIEASGHDATTCLMLHKRLSELELFHEIDQNGDGILTRSEMAAALRRLGCPLSPAELDGVLRCFDADGSGSIDFGEFYQILKDEYDSVEMRHGYTWHHFTFSLPARSRAQWALPDLNRERQISVGTAGPQLRTPDLTGHCRTSTASARSQWARPDLIRERQSSVGTAGPQPRAPDLSGKEAEEDDPRLCGFEIGDRVRLKGRLLSDLSGASLLKDDLDVPTGKVMGPGKKQGIIMIALEKNGEEMTVKASLLQKLSATKGHHHGCMCEVCFLECYGTDYYGFAPDDQDRLKWPSNRSFKIQSLATMHARRTLICPSRCHHRRAQDQGPVQDLVTAQYRVQDLLEGARRSKREIAEIAEIAEAFQL
eukprot:s488_g13.t1